jgi:predicted DNA-binding transcriptional regulator YafY
MQKPKYFLRYRAIIQKLRTCKKATFAEIRDYLQTQSELTDFDLNISKRTFDRDKNEIFSIFNVLIEFDYSNKVYSIVEDDQNEKNTRMLETLDMFNTLNMYDKNSPYIIFEKRHPQGTENLYGLLHGIKNNLQIKFLYQKFRNDEAEIRTLEPYALKEFENRWYVIGKDLKDEKIKSFALDRLTEFDITKKKFIYPKDFNAEETYKNCFGIIRPDGQEPQEIILSFKPLQGKYIKSLPLHETQQVILDTKNELQVKLNVCVTLDFIMELLSYGDNVKVLKPKSLIKKVKAAHQKALEQY